MFEATNGEGGLMLGAVAFTYGILMSFVLSGAARNRRLRRGNPAVMNYVGYVLLGLTAAVSVLAFGYAGWGLVAGQAI